VVPPGRFGYLRSSARTRITSAVTNRQSMAIVINTRIQDDFSSIALTSYDHPTDEDLSAGTPVLARPAGRSHGLRTDGPLFRADLPLLPLPHTQMRRIHPIVGISISPLTGITPQPAVRPTRWPWAKTPAGAGCAGSRSRGAWPGAGPGGPRPWRSGTSLDFGSPARG